MGGRCSQQPSSLYSSHDWLGRDRQAGGSRSRPTLPPPPPPVRSCLPAQNTLRTALDPLASETHVLTRYTVNVPLHRALRSSTLHGCGVAFPGPASSAALG